MHNAVSLAIGELTSRNTTVASCLLMVTIIALIIM